MAGTKGLLVLFAALSLAFYFNSLRDVDPFIPHFKTNISVDNHEDQIRNLLPSISNNYINVTIEKLTAGTANYMYKCISTINPNSTVLLFRIFGEGASSLCNRTHEVEMIKLFYKQKLGAQVFATFENGYVLEYLEGKTLQPSNLREPYFYIPIARKLGQLHKYKQPAKEAKNPEPNRGIFHHINEWLSVCRKVVPKDDKETHKHLDLVTQEISTLQNKLERQYGNQSLVFSHNDLNYANVIYNPKDNEADILLLDLEYAGFNFRGFDLGNHFCEMAGQGEIDWNNYPSHDTMRKFIRAYLEGNGAGEITQQEVDNLVIEAERWAQVSHIGWHVWALAMAQADNKVTSDFDYSKYSYNRWHEFVRRQEALKDIL